MTIEERVSNLEGAYYQVDQRLTDLHGNMQSLRHEMASLRQEMHQDMADLRQEMRQDMASLRQDNNALRQDNNALRQEMRQLRTHLYGGIIAIVVAIGASVIANTLIG